jgi:ribosomal protein S18 acetylase RimI-like enzyme
MPPDVPNDRPEDDEEEVEFEMEVRELEPEEVESAAEMLARAFADGPLMAVLAPDEATRPEIGRWFFESLVVYGLLYGDAFAAVEDDGDVQAAAVWWAPENVEPDQERAAESGLADGPAVIGPAGWARLLELQRAMSELHQRIAPDPHWYLALLGVAPELHGQGIGGEVLAASLEFVDEEGYPAYLETSAERNVRFYERYGFTVAGETTVEPLGLKLWGMRREPS